MPKEEVVVLVVLVLLEVVLPVLVVLALVVLQVALVVVLALGQVVLPLGQVRGVPLLVQAQRLPQVRGDLLAQALAVQHSVMVQVVEVLHPVTRISPVTKELPLQEVVANRVGVC